MTTGKTTREELAAHITRYGVAYVQHDGSVYSTDDPDGLWSECKDGEWRSVGMVPFWDITDGYLAAGTVISRKQAARRIGCDVLALE